MPAERKELHAILPNLNRRFSGITATVAAVAPLQAADLGLATVGHPLPVALPRLTWGELIRLTRRPLPSGAPRIFHARRNIEMLAGLLLRSILRRKLHLIFTSTAQRRHTAWTRFLYHRVDTLLSTSERAASWLDRKPSAIIPHGVNLSLYHPAEDRAAEWRAAGLPGRHGIGILGRVRPQKGLREFVEALCEVLPQAPDFTAVIIGETTPSFAAFEASLRETTRRHGLQDRFRWLGKLPFNELPGWFRRLSLVAAVPHNEGFGLTCLEAMASGTAVVATRTGAFELLLRDGTDGRLVPCADTPALATAFRELLKDPERLHAMGRQARIRAESEFSLQREADALNGVYRRILGMQD